MNEKPAWPCTMDDGVWYCDAHGEFDCRKCPDAVGAWWDDLTEYPSAIDAKRLRADATVLLLALRKLLSETAGTSRLRAYGIDTTGLTMANIHAAAAIAQAERRS